MLNYDEDNSIIEIAKLALGEINTSLSKRRQLRFGSKGSKVLNLITLEWFDHETQEGGGLPQLILRAGIVEELNQAYAYAKLIEDEADSIGNVREETTQQEQTNFEELWKSGKIIEWNSKASSYFTLRNIELPTECNSVKYFENANIRGVRVSAIGTAFKKVGSNLITGIMFTHLNGIRKGELGKAYAKGSNKSQSAIQIFELGENDNSLGIGEGLETTLSIRRLKGLEALPVWACGDAGNLGNFTPPPQIKNIIVAVDNDAAGISALTKLARRMKAMGKMVYSIISPIPKEDLNDYIQRVGENPYDNI